MTPKERYYRGLPRYYRAEARYYRSRRQYYRKLSNSSQDNRIEDKRGMLQSARERRRQ